MGNDLMSSRFWVACKLEGWIRLMGAVDDADSTRPVSCSHMMAATRDGSSDQGGFRSSTIELESLSIDLMYS